jgi:hypothetical protein
MGLLNDALLTTLVFASGIYTLYLLYGRRKETNELIERVVSNADDPEESEVLLSEEETLDLDGSCKMYYLTHPMTSPRVTELIRHLSNIQIKSLASLYRINFSGSSTYRLRYSLDLIYFYENIYPSTVTSNINAIYRFQQQDTIEYSVRDLIYQLDIDRDAYYTNHDDDGANNIEIMIRPFPTEESHRATLALRTEMYRPRPRLASNMNTQVQEVPQVKKIKYILKNQTLTKRLVPIECPICLVTVCKKKNRATFGCCEFHVLCTTCLKEYIKRSTDCHMCRSPVEEIILYERSIYNLMNK